MGKRTTEFVLGLLGGIFGFFGGVFALTVGGIAGVFGASDASLVSNLGWAALVFSIVGIVGSVIVRNKAKIGGWIMVICGVGGLISISFFYILPAALLLLGGFMGTFKKVKGAA